MAKTATLQVRVSNPDGVLDAIATLEHIRNDAEYRVAALRRTLAPLPDERIESLERRAAYAEEQVRRACTCPRGSAGNRLDTDRCCPIHRRSGSETREP
jgi:hypothetical protein